MNILYVVHQFFPHHYTGTERLTLQLAKQIRRMGHLVTIFTCEPSKIEDKDYVKLETHISKKIYFIDSIPIISFHNWEDGVHSDIFPPKIEQYVGEIVKDYDVVHFTHPMRNGSILKVCKALKIPTVLTLTDNWLLCPQGLVTKDLELCDGPEKGYKCMKVCNLDKSILKRYDDAKYFFENVDALFTGTEFIKQTFKDNNWNREIELNTFSMDYIHVKPIQNSNNNTIVFCFMGTIAWHKGLHVLIESFKKVSNNNIKLKIYGSGDENSKYVKSIRKESKDDDRIEFCGIFNYDELGTIMKNVSVLVIPSVYREIFPLVMQMSFAYETPIIASDIGGLPESIIHESNGYLFDAGNVIQLSELISKISKNPKILLKLKKNIVKPPHIEEEAFFYSRVYERFTKDTLSVK